MLLACFRRLALLYNTHRGGGSTPQRFDSKRTSSSEKTEHSRADDRLTQAGKDSRLDAVHCRADTALRNCQADSAGVAGDHPHGDATGLGVAVASGSAASGDKDGEGTAVIISSTRLFFFFGRSFLPRKNLV